MQPYIMHHIILSFHGGWEKNILLEHGAKDDLSRSGLQMGSCGTCQLSTVTNVNAIFIYHVVISCMQHVQLILRISHVEKEQIMIRQELFQQ